MSPRHKKMNPLKAGMRVTLTIPGLEGRAGTIMIARKYGQFVWVKMDDDLPDGTRTFDALDERAREIYVALGDVQAEGVSEETS